MKTRIFVDGSEGTTGLQINERLARRPDLEVLAIAPEKRKDPGERKRLLNQADVVFLCLPDDAARESVAMIDNPRTRVIDPSTAHRTAPGWAYGFPELSLKHREAIRSASRVSNPGCHATGFIALVAPLVAAGLLPRDYPLSCTSLTGYSGAGKKAIAQYEQAPTPANAGELAILQGERLYALGLSHKHLPEMVAHTGIAFEPVFMPVIGPFSQGMTVAVPLCSRLLGGKKATDIHATLAAHYAAQPGFVRVMPLDGAAQTDGGFLNPQALNGSNWLEIFVFGRDDQILLCARLDNLGKGASGAAVQNLNLMIGVDEDLGL